MPFTDLSDLYCAVNEEGINRVIRHVMRKRPSLFNYGTQAVITNPALRCVPMDFAPEVLAYGNPLMTREDPLPILGTDGKFGLDFCAQLTEVAIDNRSSSRYTIIEVIAQDRPGVLFRLSHALHLLGLTIAFAKVNTEGNRVVDKQ